MTMTDQRKKATIQEVVEICVGLRHSVPRFADGIDTLQALAVEALTEPAVPDARLQQAEEALDRVRNVAADLCHDPDLRLYGVRLNEILDGIPHPDPEGASTEPAVPDAVRELIPKWRAEVNGCCGCADELESALAQQGERVPEVCPDCGSLIEDLSWCGGPNPWCPEPDSGEGDD